MKYFLFVGVTYLFCFCYGDQSLPIANLDGIEMAAVQSQLRASLKPSIESVQVLSYQRTFRGSAIGVANKSINSRRISFEINISGSITLYTCDALSITYRTNLNILNCTVTRGNGPSIDSLSLGGENSFHLENVKSATSEVPQATENTREEGPSTFQSAYENGLEVVSELFRNSEVSQ